MVSKGLLTNFCHKNRVSMCQKKGNFLQVREFWPFGVRGFCCKNSIFSKNDCFLSHILGVPKSLALFCLYASYQSFSIQSSISIPVISHVYYC